MVWKTLRKKNRIIDLLLLPPCNDSLKLHVNRSNYVAKIWRQSEKDIIAYDDPQKHGWNGDFSLQWVTKILPTEVVRHLTTDETPEKE